MRDIRLAVLMWLPLGHGPRHTLLSRASGCGTRLAWLCAALSWTALVSLFGQLLSSVSFVSPPRLCDCHNQARRQCVLAVVAAPCAGAGPAFAKLLPPPPEGSCVGCLGVSEDLLAPCTGDLKGCLSSQDDRPQVFEAPWQLPELDRPGVLEEEAVATALAQLRVAVVQAGGQILRVSGDKRYLRAEFLVDLPFIGNDADDVEWYITPNDSIVQFRAERRTGQPDFGENRRRLDAIRQQLGWDTVPVLRNRQRALFFGESPLDNFGPSLFDALGPGQEPTAYETQKRARQGERLKGDPLSLTELLTNDDLGEENANGILDAATRDFLSLKCDPKLRICD